MTTENKTQFDNVESLENVDRTVTLDDVKLMLFTPGDVDIHIMHEKYIVNLNFNSVQGKIAVNSDHYKQVHFQPDSIGVYAANSEIKLQCNNEVPDLLLEIGDETLKNWCASSDVNLDEGRAFWNYRHDAMSGHIGRAAIAYLISEQNSDLPHDQLLAESLTLGLSSRIVASLSSKDGDIDNEINIWSRRGNKLRLQRAIDFANSHLSDKSLSVADMARAANLSACHFSIIFKSQTGVNPYTYILRQRTQLAYDMIVGSSKPLSVVAFETGFSNQAHMHTVIKKAYGVTPGKLRLG